MSLKTFDYTDEEIEAFSYAILDTEKGEIKIKLFSKDAPNTVSNFANLSNAGFYDNLTFHRVIEGFMAQGGCPDGSGSGGPGYSIACETKDNTKTHLRGSLSMAHAGIDTGGSQFFICFGETPHLNGVHTVFGCIDEDDTSSFESLDALEDDDKIKSIKIQAS